MVKPLLILESQVSGDVGEDFLVVDHSPFVVGRERCCDGYVPLKEISKKHATLSYRDDAWWVTDLKSTNHTFVRGEELKPGVPVHLDLGDFVSFGNRLYRVVPTTDRSGGSASSDAGKTRSVTQVGAMQLGPDLIRILEAQRTYPYFQPIVDLATEQSIGWEALGRAAGDEGPIAIGKLFVAAAVHGREVDLSLSLRDSARHCAECRYCWPNPEPAYLFFNAHPTEIRDERRFWRSLQELARSDSLRQWYQLVVEMPESLVSNVEQTRRVVEQIRGLGMLVAYDDFGQGQARLEDLVIVPPDFVKLDRRLIADLGADRALHRIVSALVDTCRELNVRTLAEGIETAEELRACRALNIELGQGFLLQTPQPAYRLFGADLRKLPTQRPQCPFVQLNLLK
jgi:EAL domain-containing protein (putative c-di-GMP-specific phosphodiesterase class I)